MNKALIFDLDGTLWDASGCACAVWERVLEKHPNIPDKAIRAQLKSLTGKTLPDIAILYYDGESLFPDVSAPVRAELLHEFEREEVAFYPFMALTSTMA